MRTIRDEPRPAEPVVHHGVAIGPTGACIVSARWEPDHWPGVYGFETFPPSLRVVGNRVRQLLEQDPTCVVTVDGGLHGADLRSYMRGLHAPRRRLHYLEVARPELRRWELGGRLRAAHERHEFGIKRIGTGSLALRAAVADAAREDSADRPEVVALSLAVINRRRIPRIA